MTNWYPFDASELTEDCKERNLKDKLNEIAATPDEESNLVITLMKYKK